MTRRTLWVLLSVLLAVQVVQAGETTKQVAEEQAIDEELRDPGLAAAIAEEKRALVDTEAIIDEELVDSGLVSPSHASCATVGPALDGIVTIDAPFNVDAANQRSGSSTTCLILGQLQPTDDAYYFCYTFASDGFTWTYLQNLRTLVHGWTRDDLLWDYGSMVHCGF